MDVIAQNGRQALIQTAHHVLNEGRTVSPRGLETREVRHLSLTVLNPRDVLCTGIGANQNPRVIAAEAAQLIGGFSDPAFAIRHAPALTRFTNARGEFDGAYGPRVGHQLPAALMRLQADADSRQAIVAIWNDDDLLREHSLDYPCTLVLGFFIRDGLLELDVTMRSNDVNWGLKNDLFQFTQLQLTMAHALGIDVGPYRHTAFSMHLYERDYDWAEQLDVNHALDPITDHPQGICVDHHDAVGRLLASMATARALADPRSAPRVDWYSSALAN